MQRLALILLVFTGIATWCAVLVFSSEDTQAEEPLPTLMILPSLTASFTPTLTDTPTVTPTASPSPTATNTPLPTLTPTLSTRVLEIFAVMPDVKLPPTATDFPFGTVLLPSVPEPVEPLPDATQFAPPFYGWYTFESDHPAMHYATAWQARQVRTASRGQYHRTEESQTVVSFTFEGEAVRVRYVVARNMGIFDVLMDGQVIDTVDAYAPELAFVFTEIYTVTRGQHTLTLRPANAKNSVSEGFTIGLDAVQVYHSESNVIIVPPQSATNTPERIPAKSIKVISTPSNSGQLENRIISVSVVIAYDENGNKAVDPAEGVREIPVRIVDTRTNQVLARAFTDASGYAQLEVETASPARVVVPYFGKVWDLPLGRTSTSPRLTLLLPPGTQPGLIP